LAPKYNLLLFRFLSIMFISLKFRIFFFFSGESNSTHFLKKINKKKTFFFKKKFNVRLLSIRRLKHVLKKKVKPRRVVDDKFFFKKFFFKTLLKGRRFLKNFFFGKRRMRQRVLTKKLHNLGTNLSKLSNFINTTEFTISNILLRSNFFFFKKDITLFSKTNKIFLNGVSVFKLNTLLFVGDCVQLPISIQYYTYMKFFKRYFKKKLAEYKKDSWKFFKKKFVRGNLHIRRKLPRYLDFFFVYKLNTPKFLEIDYLTMTLFVLKKNEFRLNDIFYYKQFNKIFFPLYNWKKIN